MAEHSHRAKSTLTLTPRLQLLADWVPQGVTFADVGTDHGHLPIWLRLQGRVTHAIASDLRKGPLERARENGAAYGADGIDYRLAAGLDAVKAEEAEVIAIAGMGGETIAAILEAAPWVQNEGIRLILQPMTRAEDLRRWLLTHGFSVLEEHLITDGRHLYPVLAAEYTAAPVCEDEVAIYGGFFTAEEGRPYRQMMAEHLLRRARGLTHSGDLVTAAQLIDLSELLKRM